MLGIYITIIADGPLWGISTLFTNEMGHPVNSVTSNYITFINEEHWGWLQGGCFRLAAVRHQPFPAVPQEQVQHTHNVHLALLKALLH